ncbi:MAG TPA: GlsB/YeaQ/YmgE family stress response membrane protein [Burkholderiales bacterium]|nr:GlsB/YeaQ/YmgE family stress response membrane protein [Burkholderiales bacterium]
MEFVWFILIGLVAGWLAGQLVKGGGFGVVGDIVVGVLGALLGGFLFSLAGFSWGGGLIGAIIVATVGAVILILLLRFIKRA